MAPSSQATIGWHLWGSVKKSFSDRTQEPRGVAGNWEKDKVGGTRRAVGVLYHGIIRAVSAEVLGRDLPATVKGRNPQR